MKRYPLVIGATAAGLAGVLSFHSRQGAQSLQLNASASGASTPASVPAPQKSRSGSSPSTPTTPTTTSPPRTHLTSATGAAYQYGYGVLSVRVTVSGSTITNVNVGELQTAETYSQQLAQQVIPILRREVLSAQSARISAVSGATYTSDAYGQSLQSALDKLHLG